MSITRLEIFAGSRLNFSTSARYTARPICRPVHSHIGIRFLGIRIHTAVNNIEKILCFTWPSDLFARSEVLTSVLLKILVLWKFTPLLNRYRLLEGSLCILNVGYLPIYTVSYPRKLESSFVIINICY